MRPACRRYCGYLLSFCGTFFRWSMELRERDAGSLPDVRALVSRYHRAAVKHCRQFAASKSLRSASVGRCARDANAESEIAAS